jgi:hypothetical protein
MTVLMTMMTGIITIMMGTMTKEVNDDDNNNVDDDA